MYLYTRTHTHIDSLSFIKSRKRNSQEYVNDEIDVESFGWGEREREREKEINKQTNKQTNKHVMDDVCLPAGAYYYHFV